jgi:Uncharacterized protein conserved in bacteria
MKITTADGPAFFIRTAYLRCVDPALLVPAAEFSDEKELDILSAGECFAAERQALSYLARAEQSRFGLVRKLSAKGMQKDHISAALDYLESIRYLSDSRYAAAWLNSRKASHHEGRVRLAAELASRGIDRHTAQETLDAYFEENPEEEECIRAAEKCVRLGMVYEKALRSLVLHGFTAASASFALETLGIKKSR